MPCAFRVRGHQVSILRSAITKGWWAYRLHEDLAETFDQELEVLCAVEATERFADLVRWCCLFAVGPLDGGDWIGDEDQQELERVGDQDLLWIFGATAQVDWKRRPGVRVVFQHLRRTCVSDVHQMYTDTRTSHQEADQEGRRNIPC